MTVNFEIQKLQKAMPQGELHFFQSIDSTNNFLLKQAFVLPKGSVCIANEQTNGKGRRGRSWQSPNNDNLYFSMLWYFDFNISENLAPLSLVVAIEVAEILSKYTKDIKVKWPNDIYFKGKKFGGILVETMKQHQEIGVVIGIGLNLGTMNWQQGLQIHQPFSSLAEFSISPFTIASKLAVQLQQNLAKFTQTGFNEFLPLWSKWDEFLNQDVKLITENGEITGTNLGVNEKGELLLHTLTGIQSFAIGEISLRIL